ncbi:hypothetical protein M4I32_13435 [Microbacterium sp. LRZ72]|uniref:hypothetical protein n=1 Tax=Microbacterium sp. LRZ72 TaxID=2942481 RepID=UPI0029A191B1|nr:hypothetical protein [Microbacterium sp. LRZ72]MDX2377803.1 hypothetical protein [Microbacterium sp. LRZ72]
MSSEPRRRRRHSPAVYRRRRLALVLAVIAVALLVWLLIAQPWSGQASSGSSPQPSATPSPTVTASEAPTGAQVEDEPTGNPGDAVPEVSDEPTAQAEDELQIAACSAAEVSVEAVTDKESYAAGEQPQLKIRLTNDSAAPCTMNVGTTQQSFTVTSGSDTWWRSTDCQAEPSDLTVTLDAGQEVESAEPVVWDRTRSSVGTCDGDRPQAPGGGASYHVDVSIGGIESTTSQQIFLY